MYNDNKESTLLQREPSETGSINALHYRIDHLISSLINDDDETTIRNSGESLIQSVNLFCNEVEKGCIQVDSRAILRALKDVTCRDISYRLNSPLLDRNTMVRELRLFSNTIRFVLNPKQRC